MALLSVSTVDKSVPYSCDSNSAYQTEKKRCNNSEFIFAIFMFYGKVLILIIDFYVEKSQVIFTKFPKCYILYG